MSTKKSNVDALDEAAALASAATRLEAFALKHTDELWGLLVTYSDVEAIELLKALREKFWSQS